jgi:hypothetical protein
MRGADAIAKFREDPTGNLEKVKESTAQLEGGLSKLRHDIKKAKVALSSGEEIFLWEYKALEKIASNAKISFEEIQERIGVQNGSIVTLDLDSTCITVLGYVAHLAMLKGLSLCGTEVSCLNPLAKLTALEVLDLSCTCPSDLRPIANLCTLRELWLWGTEIMDLSPIVRLRALRTVHFDHSPIPKTTQKIITMLETKGVAVHKDY